MYNGAPVDEKWGQNPHRYFVTILLIGVASYGALPAPSISSILFVQFTLELHKVW